MASDKPDQSSQPQARDASEAFRGQLAQNDRVARTTHDRDGVEIGGIPLPAGAKPHVPILEQGNPTVIVVSPIAPGARPDERPHQRKPGEIHQHAEVGHEQLQVPPLFGSRPPENGDRAASGLEANAANQRADKPAPTIHTRPDGGKVTIWEEGSRPPTIDEVAAAMGVQRPSKHAEKK